MKISFNTFFLGWLLARQWQLSTGQQYPKPSISVRPSNTVSLGETFSIHCESQRLKQATFYLYKWAPPNAPNIFNLVTTHQAKRYEVLFLFEKANQSAWGIYFCVFKFPPGTIWSELSDEVKINVRGRPYPKPFISGSPNNMITSGENVSIHCKSDAVSQAEFSLYQASDKSFQKIQMADGKEVTFHIINVTKLNGGLYQCSYCITSTFYELCSNDSDQIRINIKDLSLSKPSIKVKPRAGIPPGHNISIECQGPRTELNFSLYNHRDLLASQLTKPNKTTAKFPFFMVGFEDAGNYTCQYHSLECSFVWSEPSDPVELLVREDMFPESMMLIWISIISGLILLLLLLLLLIFLLYRKRRKGPAADKRSEPAHPPQEIYANVAPDSITYSELDHHSFKARPASSPDKSTMSCVYASVAQHKAKANLEPTD